MTTPSKVLFGSPEMTEYYRKSRDFIFTHQLHKAYTLDLDDNCATVTFFGCFRYQRELKTGRIKAYYYDFARQKWCVDRIIRNKWHNYFQFRVCPNIHCLNISNNLLLSMLHAMLKRVKKFIDRDKHYQRYDRATSQENRLLLSGVDSVLEKSLKRTNFAFQYSLNCVKQITKWLWLHFFDKSLISIVARIRPNCMGRIYLAECAYYQRHINAVNKIAMQYPNLLPLISRISPKYWHDPNLFSFDYWVSSEGKPYINTLAVPGSRFGIMTRKSHWRWLKKQSSQFIVNWHEQELDSFVNLERAIPNIPVCLGKTILYFNDFFRQFHPHQNHVLQLFAQYAIDYKKTHGIRQLRHYLKNKVENELYDLYDYWQHGQYQGIPKTWERLLERCQQWHRELLIQQQLRKDKAFQAQLNATWESPVQTHHIGNITFNALNTGLALFDEGQRMHHCIFSYLQLCIDKKYLAFSVVEACQDDSKQPRYSYSTLGLKRVKSKWKIEQQREIYNGSVSGKLLKISQQFCSLLNKL